MRVLVVGTAVALFLLTAVLLHRANRRVPSAFLYSYALGLVLFAAGLAGSLAFTVRDSPLNWVTRVTQSWGAVYMCIAVIASARDGAGGIPLAEVLERAWRPDELLTGIQDRPPLLGPSATAWRFWRWRWRSGRGSGSSAQVDGPLPTYITFYPVVMLVALAAGLGPGLLATALSAGVAGYWILPPVGQLSVAAPADRLSLVLFSAMGVMMCVVAELYRRALERTADYERELAVRRSKARFQRLIAQAPLPLCLVNGQGAILYERPVRSGVRVRAGRHSHARRSGRCAYPTNRTGGGWWRPWESAVIRAAKRRGHGADRVRRNPSAPSDRSERLVEVSGITIDDGFLATFVDVTARRRAEEKTLAGPLPDALREPPGRVLPGRSDPRRLRNAVRCHLSRRQPGLRAVDRPQREQLVGKRMKELVPELKSEWLEVFAQVMRTGEPVTHRAYSAVFGRHFEACVFRPMPGQFGVLVADITERKRAEEETRRLLAAVQEEKDRLSTLINSISDEVWFADTQGRFTLANPSALREFSLGDAPAVDVETLAAGLDVSPRRQPGASGGGPAPACLAGRGREEPGGDRPDAGAEELRYRQVSATPVRDASGNIVGSVSVVRHTKRKRSGKRASRQARQSTATCSRT